MPATDPLRNLGARATLRGTEVRVWSAHATAMELCIWDRVDPNWLLRTVRMTRDEHAVWSGRSMLLRAGTPYSLRASGPSGPTHDFDPARSLLDPYSRGLSRTASGQWRSHVYQDGFDWGAVKRPGTPLDHTVIYEAHVKGMTKLLPSVPEELRGTYAGLAHESTIEYLTDLGVTAVELLPVQQFVSEQRLIRQGLSNYWGYNTLGFFTPHGAYASSAAQRQGPAAILREFKTMVRQLHEAGLEVILDVVYNHTSEEGPGGPTTSLRGLDNASYYRQMEDGDYIDVTGCGNTVNFSLPAAQRLVLDSLRYWAQEMRVDGFRFDLMPALGRDENVHFDPQHPLLGAILDDPALQGLKMIAEPWDVGMGGWQVGNFPNGYLEWNDSFRDRAREFWLTDIATARYEDSAPQGIGRLARKLAGSEHIFGRERGPLASVNFITAHDGFTMADLTAYNQKHNLGNGENNHDGTDNNRSFNHGDEGPTHNPEVHAARTKAIRNLLGTLLLSAGVPMLTAGDEFARSQRGNNNAYCHDNELTWLHWGDRTQWENEIWQVARRLIELRSDNPALRAVRFGHFGATTPSANQMDWYNVEGLSMSEEDWNSPTARTLQYLAASTPEVEEVNRILLVVHGLEEDITVTLPEHEGVSGYSLLWDSALDDPDALATDFAPSSEVTMAGASMRLFRAH